MENADSVSGSTALIDGVRKFVMDVRELDVDRINPFESVFDHG